MRPVFELELQETLLAGVRVFWEEGQCEQEPPRPRASEHMSREIFATLLSYKAFTSKVLTQTDWVFIPSKADCSCLCPPSPPVDLQWPYWCRQGLLVSSWEMPGTSCFKKHIGKLWDGQGVLTIITDSARGKDPSSAPIPHKEPARVSHA